MSPTTRNIVKAIREETKRRGNTRWLEAPPQVRDSAIKSTMLQLGYRSEPPNKQSFARTLRKLFSEAWWPRVRDQIASNIPDKSG